MNKLLSLLVISLSLSVSVAYAADAPATAKPATAGKTASPKQLAQQAKMKACNRDAGDKTLKGAERKTFMSACLKG